MPPTRTGGRRAARQSTSVTVEEQSTTGDGHTQKPPKLTMKTLQKQLHDLQEVTTRLMDRLETSAHPLAVPTSVQGGMVGTATVGVTTATVTAAVTTAPNTVTTASSVSLLQNSILATSVATSSSTVPIYSTTATLGLSPPGLRMPSPSSISQSLGLGTTLASNITGLGNATSTVSSSGQIHVRPVSAIGDPSSIAYRMDNSLMQAGVHLPLDTGVSVMIKNKIWEDKFVDFKNLLPNSRPRSQYTVNLDSLEGSPTLTLASPSESNKQYLTLSQWSLAFSVYHYIYIQKHLARSPQLIMYSHLIRSLAERGAQWGKYDVLFRQLRHNTPNLPWDVPHMQLYVDAFNQFGSSPTTSKPRQQHPQGNDNSLPRGYCFRYHISGSYCPNATNCPYKHTCPTCSGLHTKYTCPKSTQPKTANPPGSSVNDGIPREFASTSYANIDAAIRHIKTLGPGCYLAKTDIQSAFRIIPVHPNDQHLLGFQLNDGFYYDRCLPMGCSTSCAIFEAVSTALEWVAVQKLNIRYPTHILDDFMFANDTYASCERDLAAFCDMCQDVGVPLAGEKTLHPDTIMSFLGIELDTIAMEARLPLDKLYRCKNAVQEFIQRSSASLKEIQSLVGLLNHVCQVVSPGRAFLRRLIDLTKRKSRGPLSGEISPHGPVPDAHPTLSPAQQLDQSVNTLLLHSLAPGTVNAYRLAWKHFRQFNRNHAPDGRLPITLPILHRLIHSLTHIVPKEYDNCLFKTMFLFMYYAFARVGEVAITREAQHTLTISDVHAELDAHGNPTSFVVTFKTYKHSKASNPSTISILAQPDSRYCPVGNIRQYLQLRGGGPGYLFLAQNASPVTSDYFAKVLHACVIQTNLDPHRYTPHSFRIGAATQAALQGVPDTTIRRLGRWSSDAFRKYLQRQHDREGMDDDESYLDKVSTRVREERPIELHVRPRGGSNFVVELTFTHTWVQLLVECSFIHTGEPVELHVRLPEKPDVHGTLVNSSSPARGVELRWDLRSPARGVELPMYQQCVHRGDYIHGSHGAHGDHISKAHGAHGSTSQFNVTHITGVKAKKGEEGWGGGIEQGGVGTEEEDVPRNMPCQTGICE
ncbi:hypothetical protein Bbelb_065080 [Branchiostoma belcheri]|nr:hypothetical protein Bbelb_065080 [Branchiostoma belcheri]